MQKFDLACTVTGAGGFVGSQLIRALNEQEDHLVRVFAVDLGEEPSDRLKDVFDNPKRAHVTWHSWDVTQPLRSDFLAVDAVYHFAGIANPEIYLNDPIRVMDLNIIGLKNILDRIVLWSAHRPRIIYSSTSECYGRNTEVPFDEETSDLVFGPTHVSRWCYAMTKAVGEHYLHAYGRFHDVRYTIFRFFNFIGPDIDAPGAGRVITRMVGDAIDKGVINVTAPGTQTRSFVHSDEFVVPLVRALTMKKYGSQDLWYDDYLINLGSDDELSMIELAQIVQEKVQSVKQVPVEIDIKSKEELFGKGYDDVQRRKPSVQVAWDVLGWRATRSSRDAVRPAIDAAIQRHLQVFM